MTQNSIGYDRADITGACQNASAATLQEKRDNAKNRERRRARCGVHTYAARAAQGARLRPLRREQRLLVRAAVGPADGGGPLGAAGGAADGRQDHREHQQHRERGDAEGDVHARVELRAALAREAKVARAARRRDARRAAEPALVPVGRAPAVPGGEGYKHLRVEGSKRLPCPEQAGSDAHGEGYKHLHVEGGYTHLPCPEQTGVPPSVWLSAPFARASRPWVSSRSTRSIHGKTSPGVPSAAHVAGT